MRQAGRYLPEYRELRSKAGSFLDLCYAPALAAEVTLQPIRRFGFDAAILFSDILVVPHALGQDVSFVEGEGPRLTPIRDGAAVAKLDRDRAPSRFEAVFETVSRVRAALAPEVALIGFCGAPWTVATYMVGGRGTPDQADARLWAYRDPQEFGRLIDLLVEVSVAYLSGQVAAGAQVLQLFDSWAGGLAADEFDRWVIEPTRRMVEAIRQRHPDVPVIGFPRGAGAKLGRYVAHTGVRAVSLSFTEDIVDARTMMGKHVVMQGNLDPLCLVAGGRALEDGIARILTATRGSAHIVNLGHGIVPETPPEHVARLVELVRHG